MTVQTNTNVASFNGNGVTQIFPIAFKFNNDTDLVVLLVDDDTGAATTLTLNSDYTVSGEGDEEGGLINVIAAPAVGQRLQVSRIVDVLQLTDLRNQGKFFAEVHEDAFDLLTMIAQQHASGIRSSLRVAESDPEPTRLPPAASRANTLMGFDAEGNPVTVAPVSGDSADLALSLANNINQSKGAALVGYKGQTVHDRLSQYVSVKDFGAVGDGVNDDTPAIQAAINATTGVLFFPAGSYRVTSTISWIKNDLWIVGAGEGASKIIADFAAGDIICIGDGVANPNNSGISHLTIGSYVAKTSGAAIRLRNGHNLKVSRIRMDNNLFFGVQLDGGPQQFLYYLDNFEISGAASAGIVVGEDGTLPQDLWISTGIVVDSQNGILLKHGSGIYLQEMDLVACGSGITTYPAAGQNVVALWANTVIADTCKSSGWKVITDGGVIAEWTLTACWGASCGVDDGGHGMVFNPGAGEIKAISITGARCINNQGNGIYIQGGEDFSIVNPQCLGNSQKTAGAKYGIEVFSGVSQFSISGGVCGQGGLFSINPQGYGIVVDPGASDNYVISGVNVLGNISGGISDGGTGLNKHIVNNIGYKTAASGSATIPAGQTSVVVSHGLASAPLHKDITLTRGTSSAGSVDLYVDPSLIGSSQFTIRTAPAPSADITINWVARTQGA